MIVVAIIVIICICYLIWKRLDREAIIKSYKDNKGVNHTKKIIKKSGGDTKRGIKWDGAIEIEKEEQPILSHHKNGFYWD